MRLRAITIITSAALLTIGLAACGGEAAESVPEAAASAPVPPAAEAGPPVGDPLGSASVAGNGNGRWGGRNQNTAPTTPTTPTAAPANLTEEEAEGLIQMREEEKLARDVYLTLYDLWGLPVFENIAASEATHTEAVLGLIEAYGLDDPVADDTVGAFTDPVPAALYDDLIARGSVSPLDALTVGALIEDLDISDLRTLLEQTDNPDIERVYGNLLRGSENHLRAFGRQLEAQGATYEAAYLDQEDVDGILASGGGRGRDR